MENRVILNLERKEVYSLREKLTFYFSVTIGLFAFFTILLLITDFNLLAIGLCVVIYLYAIYSIRLRFFVEYQHRKYILQLLPLLVIGNIIGLIILGYMINHIIMTKSYLPENFQSNPSAFLFVLMLALCVLGIVRMFTVIHNYRGFHRVRRDGIYFRYGAHSDFVKMAEIKLMAVSGSRVVYVAKKLSESIALLEWADGDKGDPIVMSKVDKLSAYLCIDPDYLIRDLVRHGWAYEVRPGCVLVKRKTLE